VNNMHTSSKVLVESAMIKFTITVLITDRSVNSARILSMLIYDSKLFNIL